MLGPEVLDYVVDFTTRQSVSVDAFLTVLQVCLHFHQPVLPSQNCLIKHALVVLYETLHRATYSSCQ